MPINFKPENVPESGESPVRESLKETIFKVADWFLPIVGLIYASGFLIVFTFFKSFGINSVDFIEAKYIHVGSLFAMACVTILLPMSWLLFLIKPYKTDPDVENIIQALWRGQVFKAGGKILQKVFWPNSPTENEHGIHATAPVIGSSVLMLWSFLLLVTFASPDLPQRHPRLVVCAFMLPLFVLGFAFPADRLKDGYLFPSSQMFLRIGRLLLRAWWLGCNLYYLFKFYRNRSWFYDHFNTLHALEKTFGVPIILVAVWLFVLWFFPIWKIGKGFLASPSAQIIIRKQQRSASIQWALYAGQWGLFLSQCWVFARIITPENLEVNLREVFFGDWSWFEFCRNFLPWLLKDTEKIRFPMGGIYFILFMLLIFFFGLRNLYRLKQIQAKPQLGSPFFSHERQTTISTVCVLGILFYFSILSFSRFIYPYIPAAKGGGDYRQSSPVQLEFAAEFTNSIPLGLEKGRQSNTLIVLDENSSFVFLANTNDPDTNGPVSWRNGDKPRVYEIRREAINSITYSFNR